MPSYLDDLKAARDNLAARVREMTESPKPNYSIDGKSVSWADLLQTYLGQLEVMDAALNRAEPFEFRSVGV